ncbi:hypothetical protein TcasGA2_TC033945 [Tribolium castaneum]|uniref:Uncharacterized protein n=1 Tax=Tribolium castaneum TaxID=7070 RepID=A0A139WDN7_TRICA|nr:hypothetical protein TcasGA2_TC033945 [Tribolium castaneum]
MKIYLCIVLLGIGTIVMGQLRHFPGGDNQHGKLYTSPPYHPRKLPTHKPLINELNNRQLAAPKSATSPK